MNPFTQHPQQQGVTYYQHWQFAMGIACRLWHSVTALAIYAIFPFFKIKPGLDLEATAAFIHERNQWIENSKSYQESSDQTSTGSAIPYSSM